jgi:hypothetical protein
MSASTYRKIHQQKLNNKKACQKFLAGLQE